MTNEPKIEHLELSLDQLEEASGSGGLTKAGPGTLVLSADNTYTGATCVQSGIIAV